MRIVTAQELGSWLAGGKVLEEDARGPKVVALKNGLFLKIFHNRRHPLLARLFPFAERFTRNTERLRDLGIPSPEVVENFWITKEKGLSGCIYRPLPGTSLEIIYRDSPEDFFHLSPDSPNSSGNYTIKEFTSAHYILEISYSLPTEN